MLSSDQALEFGQGGHARTPMTTRHANLLNCCENTTPSSHAAVGGGVLPKNRSIILFPALCLCTHARERIHGNQSPFFSFPFFTWRQYCDEELSRSAPVSAKASAATGKRSYDCCGTPYSSVGDETPHHAPSRTTERLVKTGGLNIMAPTMKLPTVD